MAAPHSSRSVTSPVLSLIAAALAVSSSPALAQDPSSPGILEPALSATTGTEVRIPHTDQVSGGQLMNLVGAVTRTAATSATSLLGHPITQSGSPNDDMRQALDDMQRAASNGDTGGMQARVSPRPASTGSRGRSGRSTSACSTTMGRSTPTRS